MFFEVHSIDQNTATQGAHQWWAPSGNLSIKTWYTWQKSQYQTWLNIKDHHLRVTSHAHGRSSLSSSRNLATLGKLIFGPANKDPLWGRERVTRHTPKGFFHTFLKTIFLYYSRPSFACHQLQVFVCSLIDSHQLLFDFISLSMRIYLAGFMKTLPPNTPLVSSSCFRPKKSPKWLI